MMMIPLNLYQHSMLDGENGTFVTDERSMMEDTSKAVIIVH